MKTSIIILTHNQLEYTKKCIDSIRRYTKTHYEIIVVDNASSDGTVSYLQHQDDIKVIFNHENLGFAKANNQGYEIATGNTIVFLNNDVVVTLGWLESMIDTLYSSESIGMVGPVTNNISGLQMIPVSYDQITLQGLQEFSSDYRRNVIGDIRKSLRLVGFCLACKRTVLDKIGLFDETFGIGNYEDDDLCLRALEKGYELYIVQDAFIHHYGSVTFREGNVDYTRLMNTNQTKLQKKWGFSVNYFMFPRPEVVNLVPNGVKRVLEIGCGMGAMAVELKERYKCKVVGVEIDSKVAKFAKYNLDKVYSDDIEVFDVSELGRFDCIICADVLEHLRDPWTVVQKLSNLLEKGGYMVISIPNAANIEVIKSLIQGDFTYKDAGLLDKTHLRFFTRKTLPKLFPTEMELKEVHSILLSYTDSEKVFVEFLGRLGKKFELDTEMIEIDALTYQFLLKAQKK
ncbi:glycosyltransferase [Priestia aryabhattai]|uniref:glycosyltransferase n=1 Tax=Priestia megaterium TaxID=1404 RepID=UPI0039B9B26F